MIQLVLSLLFFSNFQYTTLVKKEIPVYSTLQEKQFLTVSSGYEVLHRIERVMMIFSPDGLGHGYVGVQKHVKAGLLLEEEKSRLIPIEIKHASNTIFFTEVSLNESKDLVMKSTLRTYFYGGLDIAQKVQVLNKQNEPLEKLFTNQDELKISGVEVVDELRQKNFISTKFDLILEGAGNEDLLLFNPLKFSNFAKNPFTQEYRVFPVDFGYPFTETYNANIKIPEGYELDDYPIETRMTIEGNAVSFSYTPQIIGDMLKVTAKLEVKIPIIEAQKYGDLKFFMESVASKLSEPVIFKKIETR